MNNIQKLPLNHQCQGLHKQKCLCLVLVLCQDDPKHGPCNVWRINSACPPDSDVSSATQYSIATLPSPRDALVAVSFGWMETGWLVEDCYCSAADLGPPLHTAQPLITRLAMDVQRWSCTAYFWLANITRIVFGFVLAHSEISPNQRRVFCCFSLAAVLLWPWWDATHCACVSVIGRNLEITTVTGQSPIGLVRYKTGIFNRQPVDWCISTGCQRNSG